jgi:serine/threonine protein kinase
MNSTVCSGLDPTVAQPVANASLIELSDAIVSKWSRAGSADMIAALREHPALLRNRSILLNLAIEEYEAHRAAESLDLENHCARFAEFGSSICRSIHRQLEVQRFLDGQPELLEELGKPLWPKPGDDLGPFYVLEEIGFGSIAHVYLCLEGDLGNRPVVVKATPFQSFEASILGKLNHANIVPVYSAGSIADRQLHYIAMPFRGRSTLADLIDVAFQNDPPRTAECIAVAANRWTVHEKWLEREQRAFKQPLSGRGSYVGSVLAVAVQIADALEYAHEHKIIHGDLKPSNILLAPDGQPLLLDFNLSQDFFHCQAVLGGTLPYMPPEHLALIAEDKLDFSKPEFDLSADIYSFGALVYELLAGVPPVTESAHAGVRDTARDYLRKLQADVPAIRSYNPIVSRRVESVIMQCLSFDPGDRPSTMQVVKAALRREVRPLRTFTRQARLRPVLFSAIVGLPLISISGMGAYVALQPPRYVADYQQGLRALETGELKNASSFFASSARHNSCYRPARFELGRTRIALGQLDLALEDFSRMAQDDGDAHAAAYVGYCFNCKHLPSAAIPWYEQAIRTGVGSAVLYNNLGASILDGSKNLSRREQLEQADRCFAKALALGNVQTTVELNLLRHSVAKTQLDASFNPFDLWQCAQHLAVRFNGDAIVEFHIAAWYETVLRFEGQPANKRVTDEHNFSAAENAARAFFDQLRCKVQSQSPDSQIRLIPQKPLPQSRAPRYYLEPTEFPTPLS